MGGLAHRACRSTFLTFLVGTLAIAGVPPLAGFFSKDEILGQRLRRAATTALWLRPACVAAMLTAFYMFRLFFLAFFGEPPRLSTRPRAPHARVAAGMTVPLVVLAVLSSIGGLVGLPIAGRRQRLPPLPRPGAARSAGASTARRIGGHRSWCIAALIARRRGDRRWPRVRSTSAPPCSRPRSARFAPLHQLLLEQVLGRRALRRDRRASDLRRLVGLLWRRSSTERHRRHRERRPRLAVAALGRGAARSSRPATSALRARPSWSAPCCCWPTSCAMTVAAWTVPALARSSSCRWWARCSCCCCRAARSARRKRGDRWCATVGTFVLSLPLWWSFVPDARRLPVRRAGAGSRAGASATTSASTA